MSKNLENLARRLEADPFFLASALSLFQKSERFSEDAMAAHFQCSLETLALIRLCRAPAGEKHTFFSEIKQIAGKYAVDADVLAAAVRRGQALLLIQGGRAHSGLLAARDGETPHDHGAGEEGRP
jgi:hypothetical protein